MKIIVAIKQVPDTKDIKIDPQTGTMIRNGVPSIVNPDDKHALEFALSLKDQDPSIHITVLSMGPPQAADALRECLCMGADEAILLTDRQFGGADTWATAVTLAAAVRKIGAFDLILCGQQAIDGDTAQVGPQLADRLGIAQVTYAQDIKMKGDSLLVERQMEDGYEVIRTRLPVLITATRKLNTPRYMNIPAIVRVMAAEDAVTVWSNDDLQLSPEEIGLKGSPTRVKRSFSPVPASEVTFFDGQPYEQAAGLVDVLRTLNLVEK
jgi:electron transfer flavoprotein alpha/beta subunit